VSLKTQNGKEFMRHLLRLLKVFLCMKHGMYSRALLAFTGSLFHLFAVRHPIWNMFEKDINVFNEESGEISLSALARTVANDTMRFNIKHMNNRYVLVKQFIDTCSDLSHDLLDDDNRVYHRGIVVKPSDPEISTITVFFKKVITQLRRGQHKFYREPMSGMNMYMSAQEEQMHLTQWSEPRRHFITVCEDVATVEFQKLSKSISRIYPSHVADMFTDASSDVTNELSVLSLSSGSDEDEMEAIMLGARSDASEDDDISEEEHLQVQDSTRSSSVKRKKTIDGADANTEGVNDTMRDYDKEHSTRYVNRRSKKKAVHDSKEDEKKGDHGDDEDDEDYDIDDGYVSYEVESVVDARGSGSRKEYRVRWKGYGPRDDSWLTSDRFNSKECIREFEAKQKRARRGQ